MSERRRHRRSEVVATAMVLTASRYVGTYLVSNLSAGGALLMGDAMLRVGELVRVLLELPSAEFVRLEAQVVRHENREDGHLVAVAFRDAASPIERLLEDVVATARVKSFKSRTSSTVLILSRDAELSRRLENDLQLLDIHASPISSPLAAMTVLNGRRRAHTAVVDLAIGRSVGGEFLAFLAEAHPSIHRVAVMGTHATSFSFAQAVLQRDWSKIQFTDALMLPPSSQWNAADS